MIIQIILLQNALEKLFATPALIRLNDSQLDLAVNKCWIARAVGLSARSFIRPLHSPKYEFVSTSSLSHLHVAVIKMAGSQRLKNDNCHSMVL